MSAGRKVLEVIYEDLTKGYAPMALLGSSSKNTLPLGLSAVYTDAG